MNLIRFANNMNKTGTRIAGAPRRLSGRLVCALVAAGILVWLGLGLHHVGPASEEIGVRTWIFSRDAARLPSGWTLAPPLVSRVAVFPARPVAVRGRWAPAPAEGELKSKEGVRLLAAGTLQVSADPSRLRDLARAFPRGWGRAPVDGRALAAIARSMRGPLGDYASALPFTTLVQPGAVAGAALEEHLATVGLRPAANGTSLRFYPAPRAVADRGGIQDGRPSGRRVLLIGLDGADWDIIDPLMRQGRMPHMKRLVEGGVRARLKTLTPVLSPIIWTSIATGVGPDRHGIVDFLATSKTTGNQIPVTSNMRRVKAVWNILSEAGLSAGVIGWWATWPAEEVDGFIVSDRVAYQLFGVPDSGENLRRRTFPEALGLIIQPEVVAPSQVSDAEAAQILPSGPGATPEGADLHRKLKTILAASRTYLGVGLDLMAAYDPDLKAIYFEGTDTVAHSFMRYRPPQMAGVTPEQVAAYGDVVDRFYAYQDEVLGRALTLADDRTLVILCSDHGFRTGTNRPATDPRIEMGGAADWHRKFGILVMNGPGVRKGARLDDASVVDVTPTILAAMGLPVAQDMEGRALTQAFEPPLTIRTVATYETGAERPADGEPVRSAMDEEIVAKLTALGYVSQEGANALNNTGITLLDRGRYGEAAEVFRRALQQEPRFVQAQLNLGRAQMMMKDFDAAIATFRESLRLDPAQAEAYNLLGNIYMERGDYVRAEAEFRKTLDRRPDDTNARNSLGLLYDRMGRDEEAIEQYRKVVGVDPDYAEGYNNIGLIHRKRGEPRKAIDLFEQAIRADSDFPGSYNNMGLAWQDLGDLESARRAFERGLKVDPDNAVILNNLGTVDLAENSLESAKRRFEEAIASDPEYPSAYNNLGAVMGMLGRKGEAFEQYLKAVDLDPNYTDARFNIARHFLEQNKPREAAEMLEKVLAIEPRYGKALLQLGIILAQQGDMTGAIDRLNRAAREMPASPDPHNLLAEIYLGAGRRQDARRELETSLRLNAAQPRVGEMLKRLSAAASD